MTMRPSAVILALLVLVVPAAAQEDGPPTVTAADYARAESFLRTNTSALVTGATVQATWLDGERFWYRNTVAGGAEFVLVDAARRSREPAFDHERLAAAVSREADEAYDGLTLPFTSFTFSEDGQSILFDAGDRAYTCRRDGASCTSEAGGRGARGGGRPGGPPGRRGGARTAPSPDGRLAAFIREHNLRVRDVASRQERQLTTDGIEDFGYATDNAGWTKSDRPVVAWSPDSKKIATFQHDARGVGNMYLVSTDVGHPTLEAWKYPLPEDSVIFRISRVVIDVETAEMVRLQMAPDQHRSTLCDHVRCRGGWADVEWSEDGKKLAFVSTSRDHKDEYMRVANPETGEIRDVMEEHVETFFESGYGMVNWHMLAESNELIWYSQRDDWGHLYLYDLETGELDRQMTRGDWNVLQLRRVDQENRMLYFTGAGREPGDPYFQYFYSVSMDGGDVTLLTPDSANHTVTLSPSGEFFVDVFSTPVVPPRSAVRDKQGREVIALEEADISQLVAGGWQPPIPIQVLGRDGETTLHGLMYKPTNFDPSKKYPILNYVYPGPQSGSMGSRSFSASRSDKQAVAELGFIVVEIDGMGTPMRSKSFHTTYYGNMGDNTLPDQIGGIRQLAAENPWMDVDRVGIWGHSGGGFAAADGIMRYPDFYKVAVSQAGNHDNRNYEDDWGEKYQGLLVEYEDGSTNYDNQANQLLVENLKGKLLIAHGTMDNNVPPQNTMMVVNELIAANKDFDFIMFPNRRHGFGSEPYMMRRRWDYFVRHLLGAEPPAGYEIGANRRPIS